jgi:hypothetical protein
MRKIKTDNVIIEVGEENLYVYPEPNCIRSIETFCARHCSTFESRTSSPHWVVPHGKRVSHKLWLIDSIKNGCFGF